LKIGGSAAFSFRGAAAECQCDGFRKSKAFPLGGFE
jgi:hypothetical protein